MARERGIHVSERHGVNPSLCVCPLCYQETNELALLGRLPNDAEAPKHIPGPEPCDECKEHLGMGFLLLERKGDVITGRRWVIKRDAAERMFDNTEKGVAYITPELAKQIGLPYE